MPEVAVLLANVTERYVWSLISSGKLESIKLGRRRVVTAEALDAYISKLQDDERQLRAAVAAAHTSPTRQGLVSSGSGSARRRRKTT